MNKDMLERIIGVSIGLCVVVFIWWFTLSVWGSEMARVNDRCDDLGDAPFIISVFKFDMFCPTEQD